MRIIFFTSGSGSTAEYISRKLIKNNTINITNLGFLYEYNDIVESSIINLKQYFNSECSKSEYNQMHFYGVNAKNFDNIEEFHKNIWNTIITDTTDTNVGLCPNIIILVGWMHIIPKSFIIKCNNNGLNPNLTLSNNFNNDYKLLSMILALSGYAFYFYLI